MSDFENWFKTTEAYKMLEEQNYFKMDLFFFVGARNQYRHSGVQVAYLTWQHQQAKIEKLENELSTTKQVLGNVIDMEVAKVDNLKAQLNNMETCYIEKKKEVEELQKTNISLEAGLRKNSKNKQRLLGKNIELQKRIDEALQEVKGLERFTGEDCIADFDVLQGAVLHACKRLEKTLRGANA